MASSPPSATPEEPLPRRFGRYVLFDRIGRGGMADIYLARYETALGVSRLAVVKQILARLAADPQFEAMLIAEAKLASRLSHGSVVQVIDLGRENEQLFIAMEYVEGFDLNELLLRCSRAKLALPAPYALLVVCEALRSLDYAHRRTTDDGRPLGIVHRDVSPSNVLVSFEGEVKLCDFGISRAYGQSAHRPRDVDEDRVRVAGKAAYMSPEHARGENLDARADVFSAGVILWELVAGRRRARMARQEGGPDEAGKVDDLRLLEIAKRGEMPPLPDRPLPEMDALRRILDRALAPDRDARYATAAAFLADLDGYVARNRLDTSQLRFGSWLTDQLGDEIVHVRRARERAAAALQKGPPVEIRPIGPIIRTIPDAELDGDTAPSRDADGSVRDEHSPVPWHAATAPLPAMSPSDADALLRETDPEGEPALDLDAPTHAPELEPPRRSAVATASARSSAIEDPESRVPTLRPPAPQAPAASGGPLFWVLVAAGAVAAAIAAGALVWAMQ
ncbi:MAG: serine/threonine protein kinase [Deltaproteobacteria bacterium]|nr:serine/threonine protein kinase [Deltaproteobacteria bacterium]